MLTALADGNGITNGKCGSRKLSVSRTEVESRRLNFQLPVSPGLWG